MLAVWDNPGPHLDYVVTLAGHARGEHDGNVTVTLRYVPDRVVLAAAAFQAYLDAVGDGVSREEMAVTLLEDINNEVVPRWVHVTVATDAGGDDGVLSHRVTAEDRQPGWSNEAVLSRLRRY